MEFQSLNLDGCSLHYEVRESLKECFIILLHGGPGTAGCFTDEFKESLRTLGTVIDYDQRGTKRSPVQDPNTVSVSQHKLDLNTLIHEVVPPDRRLILIGHSWGALLGLDYVQDFSGVSDLVLVSCGPLTTHGWTELQENIDSRLSKNEIEHRDFLQSLLTNEMTESERSQLIEDEIRSYIHVYNVDQASVGSLMMQPLVASTMGIMSSDLNSHIENKYFTRNLQSITATVTAIHGDYDPVPMSSVFPILREGVKNFTSVTIGSCGHIPWLESQAKEAFFSAVCKSISN